MKSFYARYGMEWGMTVMDEIVAMLNARKNRVLFYAQAALPEQQFEIE